MASPWIQSHTVLLRHRKVIGLARELRLPPVYAMGHLHALWHSVIEQQEDGDLSGWSEQAIAEAAAYDGDPKTFKAALRSQKLLDADGKVHDWMEYAGRYLQARYRSHHPEKLGKPPKPKQPVVEQPTPKPTEPPVLELPPDADGPVKRNAPWKREEFDAAAKHLGMAAAEAEVCWAFYASQNWEKSNGRPVAGDPRHILTTWRSSQHRTQGGKNGSRNEGTANVGKSDEYAAAARRKQGNQMEHTRGSGVTENAASRAGVHG